MTTEVIDLTERINSKIRDDTSYEDVLAILDDILSLDNNRMMIVTNINGELRCQVVQAHWFRSSLREE